MVIGLFRPIYREVLYSDLKVVTHKSVALAAQNFMLSMAEIGYDTCPMEGSDTKRVKKILNLPRKAEITMIIAPNKSELVELCNFDKQIHELLKKYSVSEVVQIIRLFSGISKKELYKYVLNIRQEA